MKQGNNSIMGIKIAGGLADIEKVAFKFVQGDNRVIFNYPSEKAAVDAEDDSVINLYWDYADTYNFTAGQPIKLDMIIKRYGYDSTPETAVKELIMAPTLFSKSEVKAFYD